MASTVEKYLRWVDCNYYLIPDLDFYGIRAIILSGGLGRNNEAPECGKRAKNWTMLFPRQLLICPLQKQWQCMNGILWISRGIRQSRSGARLSSRQWIKWTDELSLKPVSVFGIYLKPFLWCVLVTLILTMSQLFFKKPDPERRVIWVIVDRRFHDI